MIRLVNQKPQFRIVPCVHDEAMIGLGNPVQVLKSVILAERQGKDVLHPIVDFPIVVTLQVRSGIAGRDGLN